MSQFPILKTGAVMQYPAGKNVQFSTTVVRFLDGSEQRYRLYQTPLHRWTVQLDLLEEGELNQLRDFFLGQSGRFSSFAFTDPWDGTVYPACTLSSDEMSDALRDVFDGRTALIIQENRS
jgi:phage-related protein